MALSEIRSQIRIEIGGRQDMDGVIDDSINFALQEFATMYEFDELWTGATTSTATGQSQYLLPSDLYVLWSVKDETKTNRLLERKDLRQFDSIDETKTGTPHYYSQTNRTLIVWNMVPDDNAGANYLLRIRYWKRQSVLVNDGDAHLLPFEWERGVRLKAASFVMNILDMDDKAAQKQAELDRWMGRIKLPGGARKERNKYHRINAGPMGMGY